MAAKDDEEFQDEDVGGDISEEGFEGDAETSPGGDDDVKYQIGRIVVDDGTDEYTEIDDDSADKAAAATEVDEADTVEEEQTSDKDEFLEEANVDLDDPERYWDS
jgi:hypothetical protein